MEPENTQEENIIAKQRVFPEGPLKQMLLDYVGNKLKPESGEITVEMIVTVLAQEFPEFVLLVAEENFIRGYQQALNDVEQFNAANNTINEEQKDAPAKEV